MSDTVKVVRVLDGGTFAGKRDGVEKTKYYNLLGVRAPAKGQNRFRPAKDALENLILDRDVSVEQKATGHYRRALVEVKIDGIDVNGAMQKYAV